LPHLQARAVLLLLCWSLQPWFPSSFFPPGFRIQSAGQALLSVSLRKQDRL
jgi:hypothetical protein